VIGILEFKTFLTGTGYPTGKITRAGMIMSKILYPQVYMGNLMCIIFIDGYRYEMILSDEYIYVAISSLTCQRKQRRRKGQAGVCV
jgi:hypothetical protein